MLLLILTSRRMVSVLLKSQVQQAQSIAGCQMSLEPRSALWLNAHRIQGSNAKQLLDASDICNSSQQCVCCVIILGRVLELQLACCQVFVSTLM